MSTPFTGVFVHVRECTVCTLRGAFERSMHQSSSMCGMLLTRVSTKNHQVSPRALLRQLSRLHLDLDDVTTLSPSGLRDSAHHVVHVSKCSVGFVGKLFI